MEIIEGIVDTIVFKNEENGYVVGKIRYGKNLVTIVGIIPYISENQHLKLKGEWILHPSFGRQLKVEECEEIMPNTLEGGEKYLASGLIYGIGPITAKK
jgi:exodeoxyribonuclease V alpha subunit